MNTFPLIKQKWSNEHYMAALFVVLILYHLPQWKDNPADISNFLILIATGLLMDAAASIIKYKRIWCCVSGGVTAAILSVLTPGISLWKQLLGLAIALIIGKYIWGGTGKNKINPAITGLLIVMIVTKVPYPIFSSSYLFIPAMLFSLPFLKFRPFAGMGFIIGGALGLILHNDFSLAGILSNGIIFWSCIVLTDPVTVTRHRLAGAAAGFTAGFIALFTAKDSWIFAAVVLMVNLLSFIIENTDRAPGKTKPRFKMPKMFSFEEDRFIDLTGEHVRIEEAELGILELTVEEITNNLKYNDVFGMAGAAYPTYKKLTSVLASEAKAKYMIINGVECDPALIHDHYILRHFTDEIVKGVQILNRCVGFQSIHLAVKSDDKIKLPEDIIIHKVPDRYPMGAEKILIKEILGISLKKAQLPALEGIFVLNVQTVLAVYNAVFLNKSADTRFLTAANLKDKSVKVVKVRLGMKLQDIMEQVYPGTKRIFAGGGIMQAYSADEATIIDKGINFIATGEFPRYKESPQCSNCGSCIEHCPAGLMVNKIADLVDQGKGKDTIKYNPSECISCGSCSYVCLAGRNLSEKVKLAKNIE